MPRYFLHLWRSGERIEHHDGLELPDLGAAREEALASARDFWAEAMQEGVDLSGDRFDILDDRGTRLTSVAFTDALPPGLRPSVRK